MHACGGQDSEVEAFLETEVLNIAWRLVPLGGMPVYRCPKGYTPVFKIVDVRCAVHHSQDTHAIPNLFFAHYLLPRHATPSFLVEPHPLVSTLLAS